MSTVVVVKKNGRAAIAADSCSSQGDTNCLGHYKEHPGKIHMAGASYVGITGSVTHHNVFENLIETQGHLLKLGSRQDIFRTFLKLHARLKKEYFLMPEEDDKEQPYESSQLTVLIANPNGIFEVYSYREVTEYTRFWAMGSGSDYALGSLFALYDRLEDPEEIAREAVAAAAEFDNATAIPVDSHSVALRKGRPTTKATTRRTTGSRKKPPGR